MTTFDALSTSPALTAHLAGCEISVAMSDMDVSIEGLGPLDDAVLIAGPTASGKSALALAMAERCSGAVINADSMQVYSVLRVLTARPTDEDLARAPHHLYGHVCPGVAYSTGLWLRDVQRLAASGALGGRRPIFVGGTGLYFKALLGGLSEMPPIAAEIRDCLRAELEEHGAQGLYDQLVREDPEAAVALEPADGQRIVRALEVLRQTGRSIREWREQKGAPLVNMDTARLVVLAPERDWLTARIEARFDQMMGLGAREEAAAMMRLDLNPAMPAMKAIGVRELGAASRGEITEGDAISLAKTATRQYAKRQSTWMRSQFGPEWKRAATISAAARLLE